MTNLFFVSLLQIAIFHCEHERYETALTILESFQLSRSSDYWYYRSVCEHQSMKYSACLVSIDRCEYEADVRNFPRGRLAVLDIMRADIGRNRPGLEDIHRRMGRVSRRIGSDLDPRQETQDQQKKIVEELDKLIKKKQDDLDKMTTITVEVSGRAQPLDDSKLTPPIASPGEVEDKVRNLTAKWGGLGPAERAKALQSLSREVPARYRGLIEEYFKSLNRDERSKK